jgi:hypothetical protein
MAPSPSSSTPLHSSGGGDAQLRGGAQKPKPNISQAKRIRKEKHRLLFKVRRVRRLVFTPPPIPERADLISDILTYENRDVWRICS